MSTEITRKTNETDIRIVFNMRGTGSCNIDSGCGFLDHMLSLFARHGRFDLTVKCTGDTEVDYHHTTEDVAIVLGTCIRRELGDHRGICRYGDIILPMDETLILCAVDVSNRPYLNFDVRFPTDKVGDFDTELVKEFMIAFSTNAGINLHLKQLAGENSHHIAEASFKALARALRKAVSIDPDAKDEIPSTKGILS